MKLEIVSLVFPRNQFNALQVGRSDAGFFKGLLDCFSAVGRLRWVGGAMVICPDISKTIQGGGPPSHKLVYKPQ